MRGLIRCLLIASILTMAAATIAPPAGACSCAPFATAAQHLEHTDIAFIGRVVASEAQGAHRMVTTFEVLETLKGAPSKIMRVEHNADVCCICGLTYRRGQQSLVFAHAKDGGGFSTSSCSAPRFTLEEYRAALEATARGPAQSK